MAGETHAFRLSHKSLEILYGADYFVVIEPFDLKLKLTGYDLCPHSLFNDRYKLLSCKFGFLAFQWNRERQNSKRANSFIS